AQALGASGRVPGAIAPMELDDDYLVDGGLLDNLPVDAVKNFSNYATIIAVDVAGAMTDVSGTTPNLLDVLRRIIALGSLHRIKESLEKSGTALCLSPPVDKIPAGNFSYKNAKEAERIGYDYARPILEKWWKKRNHVG